MKAKSELLADRGEAVFHALEARRSVKRMRPEGPTRELIERVIEAGAWAPNHYRTEPWRFVVIQGAARLALGEVMAESLRARMDEAESAEARARLETERNKPLRAPVLVAVAAVPSDLPKVEEIEEISAVSAAVQNMLLAAEALGLSAMWRTGKPARDPAVKRFLGLPESAHIVAFVYLGYADDVPVFTRERDAARHTTWLG